MSRTSVDLTTLPAPPAGEAEATSSEIPSTPSILTNGSYKKSSGENEADGEIAKPLDKARKQKAPPAKPTGDAAGNEPGGGLTNAELKKRAKAEKAAKRAQAKEGKPETVLPDLSGPRKVDTLPEAKRNTTAGGAPGTSGTSASKGHHRPTTSLQKNIPLRSASQPQVIQIPQQPEKENKNVALFGHLYSQPRRTTIAGAGKDVHPAVLALGLQMSNYVICGSNARCVAMLLVFKRVWTTSITDSRWLLIRN